MNTYYSPQNQTFHQAPSPQQDWVEANIPFEDTRWAIVSEYQEDIDGEMVTRYAFAIDEGTKALDLQNEAEISAAIARYELLNQQILADAAQAAGTTNVLSSITDIITYMRMSQRPELFDREGIVAKKAVGTFQQGDPLDNDVKVKQYADLMMAETDAFLIRRLKKITEYILEA